MKSAALSSLREAQIEQGDPILDRLQREAAQNQVGPGMRGGMRDAPQRYFQA